MNHSALLVPLAFLALTSASARAAASPSTNAPASVDRGAAQQPRPRTVPDVTDLRFNAGLGAGRGKTLSGIVGSLLLTYRYSFIQGGLLLEGGTEVIGGKYGLIGGVLGPVWQSPDGPRLELMGVAGRSGYSGIGCGLFCDSGGASATMPFVGARAGVSYVFKSRTRQHVELGASIGVGSDVRREHVDYTTTTHGFIFNDEQTTNPESTTLGGMRSTALFVLGTSLDVGR